MRWRTWIGGGMMLWAACTHRAVAQESSRIPEPILTSLYDFKVPFTVDPQEPVDKVQLHVSTDRGQTWHLTQTVAASAGKFAFQAPFDGEYWFATRSLDAQGRATTVEPFEPELCVIVGPRDKAKLTSAQQSPEPTQGEPNDDAFRTLGELSEIRPRMVNSRTLDIDYEAPTGNETPREIAVWLTRDGGQHWTRHVTDADCRSPARISVDRDGLYGLWIVMTDANGARAPEPKSGEAPGVWIGVDTTNPQARLLTAETATVRGEPELTIRWEALDAKLPAAPVTLSYRATPTDPWQPLASNLLNTGVHRVKPVGKLPQVVQLRLEVRDEAGNVAVVESQDPISTVARAAISGGRSEQATLRGSQTYQILR